MKRLIIPLIAITFMTFTILVNANRHLDNNPPSIENIEISFIGSHYKPLRQGYLEGESRILNRTVKVNVLPEKAETLKIGDQVPIVVGKGLLGINWVSTKESHNKYNTLIFKLFYLGIFCFLFVLITFLYFKIAKKNNSSAIASPLFLACIIASLLLFYLS